MAQSVSVVCPSCEAVLKVTKPSLIGKRVACPSCKKPVLIQAPTEGSTPPRLLKTKRPLQSSAPPASRSFRARNRPFGGRRRSRTACEVAPRQSPAAGSSQAKSAERPGRKGTEVSRLETDGADGNGRIRGHASDSEEADDPTVELAFAERTAIRAARSDQAERRRRSERRRWDAARYRRRAGRADGGNAGSRTVREEKTSKAKRAAKPPSDEFDVLSDDAEPAATVLRRGRLVLHATGRDCTPRSKSNAAQKLPLIIGALVGGSLLIGLLFYSSLRCPRSRPLGHVARRERGHRCARGKTTTQRRRACKRKRADRLQQKPSRTTAKAAQMRSPRPIGRAETARIERPNRPVKRRAMRGPAAPGHKALAATIALGDDRDKGRR